MGDKSADQATLQHDFRPEDPLFAQQLDHKVVRMRKLAIIWRFIAFAALATSTVVGAQEGYPPNTLAPMVDLDLRPVQVQVPEALRNSVPDDLTLNVPPGFSVSVFATGFNKPRLMAFDANGVLYVGDMRNGRIVALPDADGDGVADRRVIALRGFVEGHSLAFYKGDLYVGDEDQIVRARDNDGDLVYEEQEVFIADIPWEGWHDTRTIVFDEINEKLYVSVGSSCDLCREEEGFQVVGNTKEVVPFSPERGKILQFNDDGSGRRIFATGARNVIGMAMHPITNELWGNNNGHNLEGRTSPPEWIDIIRDGDFMGAPFVNSYQVWNDFSIPDYQKVLPITPSDSLLVATQKRPVALVPAHYAPMGIHFYTQDQFPATYWNAAFVAFHAGRAKKSSHPGYNVSVLFSEPDGSDARIGEFMTGFQTGTTENSVWGFPVGLISDGEGSLYVTSDKRTNVILKVTHSPVTGSWQHNVPDVINAGSGSFQVQVMVQVERLVPDGGSPRVMADLSSLGGPEALSLIEGEGNSYRLDFPLDLNDLPNGKYALRARLEQEVDGELRGLEFSHTLSIVPPEDLPMLDDIMAANWQIDGDKGAHVLGPTADGPVFHGETAMAVQVAPEAFLKNWSVELSPAASIDPFGFAGLRFAFHPGSIEEPQVNVLNLFVNDSAVDLVRDPKKARIDVVRSEWQIVEVPFEAFEPKLQGPVTSVRLEGYQTGTFYLDDVRLVKAIPAGPPSFVTAVLEEQTEANPDVFVLEQNYPNPFNSETEIKYSLPEATTVDLVVYNMAGQKVARLVYGRREAGVYSVRWDGLDDADRELATGMYIYRLTAGERTIARKLLLVR